MRLPTAYLVDAGIAPAQSLAKQVLHPTVPGVDLLARHQGWQIQMLRTGGALFGVADRPLMCGAMPAALDRGRVQAGAAVDLGRRLPMADWGMLTPAAQIPGRIVADAIRWQARLNHPLRFVE